MKKPIRATLSAIVLVILFVLAQAIGGIGFGLYYLFTTPHALTITDISPLMQWLSKNLLPITAISDAGIVGIVFILFLIRNVKIRDYIPLKPFSPMLLPRLFAYALGLQLIGILIDNALNTVLPIKESFEKFEEGIKYTPFVALFIVVAILAPLMEEFFFRGIIFKKLKNHLPYAVALIVQALFFGIMHMTWAQLVPTFIFALVAGHLYHKTNTIAVPITLHFIFNAVAISSTLVPESQAIWILALNGAGLALSCIFIIYDFIKRKNHPIEEDLWVEEPHDYKIS